MLDSLCRSVAILKACQYSVSCMNVAKDNKGNFVKKDAVLTCYSVNSVWRLNFCTTTLRFFLEPKGYPLLANAVRPFHKRPIAISGNAQAVATRFEHVEMILPGWLLAKSRMRIWYLDCVKCHFDLKAEMRRCLHLYTIET